MDVRDFQQDLPEAAAVVRRAGRSFGVSGVTGQTPRG